MNELRWTGLIFAALVQGFLDGGEAEGAGDWAGEFRANKRKMQTMVHRIGDLRGTGRNGIWKTTIWFTDFIFKLIGFTLNYSTTKK
jgi:hypothetical protein